MPLPVRAAEPLPVRLSYEQFWRLVVDLSEPDGAFRFDNFVSNEITYQRVIPELKRDALRSERLVDIQSRLDEVSEVRDPVLGALGDELPVNVSDGGFIRDGYDASLDDPQGPCIVMEYIKGVTLDTLLRRNGPLRPARISRLSGPVATSGGNVSHT